MTVLIESRIWYLERYSTDKTVIKVDVGKIDTIIPIPQTLMDRIRKICEYIAGYFIFILSYTKLKLLESLCYSLRRLFHFSFRHSNSYTRQRFELFECRVAKSEETNDTRIAMEYA